MDVLFLELWVAVNSVYQQFILLKHTHGSMYCAHKWHKGLHGTDTIDKLHETICQQLGVCEFRNLLERSLSNNPNMYAFNIAMRMKYYGARKSAKKLIETIDNGQNMHISNLRAELEDDIAIKMEIYKKIAAQPSNAPIAKKARAYIEQHMTAIRIAYNRNIETINSASRVALVDDNVIVIHIKKNTPLPKKHIENVDGKLILIMYLHDV
jgi:hypothetical protein